MKGLLQHTVTEMETELGTDREAAMADMRYTFIGLCADLVKKQGESREHQRGIPYCAVLTHKVFAILFSLAFMALVFWLTFR